MDTPGMRTVGLWADADDLAAGFADIEALARECRFPDCRHQAEPGCAVRKALDEGTLEEGRWEGWRRQEREVRFLEARADRGLQKAQKDKWKAIHKGMRDFTKERRSGAAG
jgi:ribosome biogenesis GTPase